MPILHKISIATCDTKCKMKNQFHSQVLPLMIHTYILGTVYFGNVSAEVGESNFCPRQRDPNANINKY